jgi:hypothetical protein
MGVRTLVFVTLFFFFENLVFVTGAAQPSTTRNHCPRLCRSLGHRWCKSMRCVMTVQASFLGKLI